MENLITEFSSPDIETPRVLFEKKRKKTEREVAPYLEELSACS